MKKLSILLALALFLCLVPNAWAAEGVPIEVIEADGVSVVLLVPDIPEEQPDFTLPKALTRIRQGAFEGISAARVRVSDKVTAIESRAFADCVNLREIIIPASVTEIDDSAFDSCAGVTVYGEARSEAARIAGQHGFSFVDSSPLQPTPIFQTTEPVPVLPAVPMS